MSAAPAQTEYDSRIAVAAIDILGVRNLVARDDQSASAMNVLRIFLRNACEPRFFSRTDISDTPAGHLFAADLYFGDSVYLIGDRSLPLSTQVSRLAVRVSLLIALGIVSNPGFLVRAGIAVGDLRTERAELGGVERELRIGSAMVRANELENAQIWIGAAIDADAPVDTDTGSMLVGESPPLKPGQEKWSAAQALNWVGTGCQEELLLTCLKLGAHQIAECPPVDVSAKLDNTIKFVERRFKERRFLPRDMSITMVMARALIASMSRRP